MRGSGLLLLSSVQNSVARNSDCGLSDLPPDQLFKMIGLVLASYRTDSILCSRNTGCVAPCGSSRLTD